jgi:hypothetical protein
MLKPCARTFWTVYCESATSCASSGRVAVVVTVGPASCIGAVPAGEVPVGKGAHSTPGPSVVGPSGTPPSSLVGTSLGVSSAVSLPVGLSLPMSTGASLTPVSGFGDCDPPLHAPIPSASTAASHG